MLSLATRYFAPPPALCHLPSENTYLHKLDHTQTHTHTNIYSFHAQNRTHKEKDRPYKAKAVPQPTKVSNPISICCRARLEKARHGPAVAYALVYACNLEPALVPTIPTAADPNLQEDIVTSPVRCQGSPLKKRKKSLKKKHF